MPLRPPGPRPLPPVPGQMQPSPYDGPRTLYVVCWIDPSMRIVDVGTYTERSPTCPNMNKLRSLMLREITASSLEECDRILGHMLVHEYDLRPFRARLEKLRTDRAVFLEDANGGARGPRLVATEPRRPHR